MASNQALMNGWSETNMNNLRAFLVVPLPFRNELLCVSELTDGTFGVEVKRKLGGTAQMQIVQPHHLARAIEDISRENRGEK